MLASSDADPFSTDSSSLSRKDSCGGGGVSALGRGAGALGACGCAGRGPGDRRWMEKLAERSGSSGSSVRRFCAEQDAVALLLLLRYKQTFEVRCRISRSKAWQRAVSMQT